MWVTRFAMIGIAIVYLGVVSVYAFYIAPRAFKLPNSLRLLVSVLMVAIMGGTVFLQYLVVAEAGRRGLDGNFYFILIAAQLAITTVIVLTAAYILDKNGTYDVARRYRESKGYK